MRLSDRELLIKIKNDRCLLELRHLLSADERATFADVLKWSPALIGILASDHNSSIFALLNRLDPSDRTVMGSVCEWSPVLIGLMAKHGDAVLSWLNKLSNSELSACRDLWDWPANLIDRLHAEPQHIMPFYHMWDMVNDRAEFIKQYFQIVDDQRYDSKTMTDAWSQGQIDSKAWLCATAAILGIKLGKTWVLCGWIGTLSYLMLIRRQQLGITQIRSFDINPDCWQLAETLNKSMVKDGWKFKATTINVNELVYDDFCYQLVKHDATLTDVCESADTVINTSCDHMGDDRTWWDRIPKGKLVILQNNDWYENDQHNNSVKDIGEFKRQYPMSELLFEGEIGCTLYTRFMLIGRK